ncbi:MAG: GMC family oxidoreductase N-terminal domain-containing protein [Steroidobacteraceae bacterium]
MESFDYIVIGAGTAGCIVASRLAARRRVLLLEAGGTDRRFWVAVPIGYGRTFANPAVNWMYQAEPDAALDGRCAYVSRGKLLGGSGAINAMVYVRGQPHDYDDWRALGNPGWSFEDVRPLFERAERQIHLTDISSFAHPLTHAYLESSRRVGLPVSDNFNGSQMEGVGIYRFTTRGGTRDSTARSYLRPALRAAGNSLQLRLHAHTLRVLVEQRRAVGVQYRHRGRTLEARASRGVILCAGSVNTPQLLQLSGLGPAPLLARHGIPLLNNMPAVGRNLQDHLAVSYFYRSTIPTLNNELHPWHGKLRAIARYLTTRSGPLSMSVNQGGGFVRSDPSQQHPNLQLYFNPMSFTTTTGLQRRLLKPDPFPAFLISCNASRPTSRGHLEIRSANPFEQPAIYMNSLSTEQDVAEVLAGTQLLRQITATAPLGDYNAGEFLPGAAAQSDADRLADFRRRAWSVFHLVGTCAMGPDPASAVVDARLRVHGVEALRIVDSSIFPTVTSGNTNAPTIMVAEKGAALIAEDER